MRPWVNKRAAASGLGVRETIPLTRERLADIALCVEEPGAIGQVP
jgi:hypothetical protein